jgi:hypothetical protein
VLVHSALLRNFRDAKARLVFRAPRFAQKISSQPAAFWAGNPGARPFRIAEENFVHNDAEKKDIRFFEVHCAQKYGGSPHNDAKTLRISSTFVKKKRLKKKLKKKISKKNFKKKNKKQRMVPVICRELQIFFFVSFFSNFRASACSIRNRPA